MGKKIREIYLVIVCTILVSCSILSGPEPIDHIILDQYQAETPPLSWLWLKEDSTFYWQTLWTDTLANVLEGDFYINQDTLVFHKVFKFFRNGTGAVSDSTHLEDFKLPIGEITREWFYLYMTRDDFGKLKNILEINRWVKFCRGSCPIG